MADGGSAARNIAILRLFRATKSFRSMRMVRTGRPTHRGSDRANQAERRGFEVRGVEWRFGFRGGFIFWSGREGEGDKLVN